MNPRNAAPHAIIHRAGRLFFAAAIFLAACGAAPAPSDGRQADPPLEAKVDRLLIQLDAASKNERDAAEKELLAIGPAVLNVLPQGDAKLSPEVRQRLTRVRRSLERQYAAAAGDASRVTLSGKKPIGEVLSELGKQTGNRLLLVGADASAQVETAFDKTPFWEALDAVLDQAQLTVVTRPKGRDEQALFLSPRKGTDEDRAGRASYVGPFRVHVGPFSLARHEADAAKDLARATIEVEWEPRLRPIALSLAASDFSAVDQRGTRITPSTPTAQWSTASLGGQTSVAFDIPVTAPARGAKEIAKVSARLSVLLPGNELTFRFDRLGVVRPTMRKMADATVILESFQEEKETWKARMRVVYNDPHDAVQSHHGWLYERRARLFDKNDREVKLAGIEANAAEDGVQAVYTWPAQKAEKFAGYRLEYTTAAVILSAPLEFAVEKVPIRE